MGSHWAIRSYNSIYDNNDNNNNNKDNNNNKNKSVSHKI